MFLQTVTVDGVRVNAFDILASNGVVHIIDAVMIAPAGDIVTQLNDHYDFTTLVSKVTQAGLAGDLMGKQRHQQYNVLCTKHDLFWLASLHLCSLTVAGNNLTVFAPNNAAFAKLSTAALQRLENDKNMLRGKQL